MANQVLPELKPTFGGAFTVQEGEQLKATWGDPNLPATSVMEQLDALIAQKEKSVRGAQRQLNNQDLDAEAEAAIAAGADRAAVMQRLQEMRSAQ